jgi:hypothetical protein
MEDQQEKFDRPDDGDEVEAHKFVGEDESKREKFAGPADEDDDVEAHKR